MRKDSAARSVPLVRRDAPRAFPLEEKVEGRLIRPQTTEGRPQISKPFSPKLTEREIPQKIPSRKEHEMLTSMDGETRPSGQEQRSQWHGQQHCSAQKT